MYNNTEIIRKIHICNGVSPVASGNKSLSCLPTTTRSMTTGENHLFPFANNDS